MPILAKRKRSSANQLRTNLVVGLPMQPNASVEARYKRRLDRLISQMTADVSKQVLALFDSTAAEQYFASDESIASKAARMTKSLIDKYDDIFARAATPISEEFISSANSASSASVHGSLKKLSGGLSLPTSGISKSMREILKASVSENVALIKSIPQRYLLEVQGAVMRSITTGNGMQDLVPFLKKHKEITERRARMIATDQTRKAHNNLAKGRLEKVGITKYRWLHTSGSNEPRPLHKNILNGQIFSFDDPPVIDDDTGERGIPGQAINCFVGSTKVSLANGCRNIWRFVYEGPMVNLVVGADVIQCTPNHPILTDKGWLRADEIKKGDQLAGSGLYDPDGIDGKINQSVSSFEDLFIASVAANGAVTSTGDKFNFHGDIPDGDVDTVSTNNYLPLWAESIDEKEIEKLALAFPDCHIDDTSLSIKKLFCVSDKFHTVFSGHVYTLESYSGWYTVASSGIISKNCRCRMVPVIDFGDDGK